MTSVFLRLPKAFQKRIRDGQVPPAASQSNIGLVASMEIGAAGKFQVKFFAKAFDIMLIGRLVSRVENFYAF